MNTRKRDGGDYRNKIFKYLHAENTLETVNDYKGNEVALNLTKRIMLNRPYKNPEYEKERIRLMQKVNNKVKEMQQNRMKEE